MKGDQFDLLALMQYEIDRDKERYTGGVLGSVAYYLSSATEVLGVPQL